MSATTTANPLQIEITKAKIAGVMIATGATLAIFGSFGMMRSLVFGGSASISQAEEVRPPAGLFERQADGFVVPTPQPTMEMPASMSEYPVIEAVTGSDAPSELDEIWRNRNHGALPADQVVPGCAPCPEGSGFKTGTGNVAVERNVSSQNSGFTTTSGMRGGK